MAGEIAKVRTVYQQGAVQRGIVDALLEKED